MCIKGVGVWLGAQSSSKNKRQSQGFELCSPCEQTLSQHRLRPSLDHRVNRPLLDSENPHRPGREETGCERVNVLKLPPPPRPPSPLEAQESPACHTLCPLSLGAERGDPSLALTVKRTERLALPVACAETSSSSAGGTRQVPLSEHFLAGLASADLRPEEVLESVHIPHSQRVRRARPSCSWELLLALWHRIRRLYTEAEGGDVCQSHDFLFPSGSCRPQPPGQAAGVGAGCCFSCGCGC